MHLGALRVVVNLRLAWCSRLVAGLILCYSTTMHVVLYAAGLQGSQSRYLFALCCMQLGKLTEAESALLPDNDVSKVPNGAAGLYLLGRIYQLSTRHSVAIAYFGNALQLDPMMWCAYEELCNLGAEREAEEYVNASSTPGAGMPPVGGSLAAELVVPQQPHTAGPAVPATQTPPMPTATGPVPMSTGQGARGVRTGGWTWGLQTTPPVQGAEGYVTPTFAGAPAGPPRAPRGNNVWPPPGAQQQGHGISPPLLGSGVPGSFVMQGRKFLDEGKMRKVGIERKQTLQYALATLNLVCFA